MLHTARSVVWQWSQQQWSRQETMRASVLLEVQTAAVCQGRAGQGKECEESAELPKGGRLAQALSRACTSRSEALRHANTHY